MVMKNTVSSYGMAAKIHEREDNMYTKAVIRKVIDMYLEECRKALLKGERIQMTGIGTIIPEVRTHRREYGLPTCSEVRRDAPYTKIRMSLNDSLRTDLRDTLLNNLENGIMGLEKRLFDKQQIRILKDGGFIPDDVVIEGQED